MTLHTTIKAAAAAAALSFAATTASAETLSYSAALSGPFATVTFQAAPVSLANNPAGAGKIVLTGASAASGLSDPLTAWCFDVTRTLVTNTSVTYNVGASFLSGDSLGRVERVFDANYATLNLGDSQKTAAFQMAIWEAIYDDDWLLTTGSFQASTADAQINEFAKLFLKNAKDHGQDRVWNVIQLEAKSPTSQNLGTVSLIPIPAGALLILSAVGLAAGVRRYGRSA